MLHRFVKPGLVTLAVLATFGWPTLSLAQSVAFSNAGTSASIWHLGPIPTLPPLPHFPLLPNFISGHWPSSTPLPTPQQPQPQPITRPTAIVNGTSCPAGSQILTQSCTANYPNPHCVTYCGPVAMPVATPIVIPVPTPTPVIVQQGQSWIVYPSTTNTHSSIAFASVSQSQTGPVATPTVTPTVTPPYTYVPPTPFPASTITVQGTQCPAGTQMITMACTQNYPKPSCVSYCQPGTTTITATPTPSPTPISKGPSNWPTAAYSTWVWTPNN